MKWESTDVQTFARPHCTQIWRNRTHWVYTYCTSSRAMCSVFCHFTLR